MTMNISAFAADEINDSDILKILNTGSTLSFKVKVI